jgi:Rod binding domain-containing protein
MTIANLPQGFTFAPAGAKVDAAAAAREFEALLIAQLLKTARQAGEALGEASTQTGVEGYLELAEEHIARVMAQRGAFGISQLVSKGLDRPHTQPAAITQPTAMAAPEPRPMPD